DVPLTQGHADRPGLALQVLGHEVDGPGVDAEAGLESHSVEADDEAGGFFLGPPAALGPAGHLAAEAPADADASVAVLGGVHVVAGAGRGVEAFPAFAVRLGEGAELGRVEGAEHALHALD